MRSTTVFRALIAMTFASCLLPTSAISKEASDSERKAMSVQLANYVHDPYGYDSHPHAFGGSGKAEIGTAAVEGHYALADWRSLDGKHWGQIAFFYMCDHWNVAEVTNDRRIRAKELAAIRSVAPGESATPNLVAEVRELEGRHVAFLRPSRPFRGC